MKKIVTRPFFTKSGTVEKGTTKARDVGFPTVNIHCDEPDISGTYAGKVVVGESEYDAAIYANQKMQVLEAHLLDFSGDLYGQRITVILIKKIVAAKVFQDAQDERSFIASAVEAVRKYLLLSGV